MIKESLTELCALYDREGSPAWPMLWQRALEDLPLADVTAAFLELQKTFVPTMACPFPVPAHIRQIVLAPRKIAAFRDAETAWQTVLDGCTRWHPQLQIDLGFTELVEGGVRAAGGIARIWNAERHELPHIKKDFTEYFLREALHGQN